MVNHEKYYQKGSSNISRSCDAFNYHGSRASRVHHLHRPCLLSTPSLSSYMEPLLSVKVRHSIIRRNFSLRSASGIGMKQRLLCIVLVLMLALGLSVQTSQARGWCGPGLFFGAAVGAAAVSSAIYYGLNPSPPTYYVAAPAYYPAPVVYSQPAPVVYSSAPVTYVAPQNTGVTPSTPSVPYGFVSGSTIKSPYSPFAMSLNGRTSGSLVYDANTGDPFKVP